jgi:hypothetical protein
VRFVSADVLIGELSHAAGLGTLDTTLTPYLQPHVLVLDEIGCLAHAAVALNVLNRVVNERNLRGLPILVTTNKPLAAWGHVLHDGDLAEAIIDRLLERGAHFAMRGRSYRTRHLKETEGVDHADALQPSRLRPRQNLEKKCDGTERTHRCSGKHPASDIARSPGEGADALTPTVTQLS